MMKRLFYFIMIVAGIVACSDDDSFSTSRNNVLTLPADTLMLDTVFSNTPSSMYAFWVRNGSGDGIRIGSVRLERGNQTGFRVNVDGVYLDNNNGSIAHDFEVRKGDSIRVFVELTSRNNGELEPQKVSDRLLFALESGVEQGITLCAYSWDAEMVDSLIVEENTTLAPVRPYVVRRGIKVNEGKTLTIAAGTKMFFHDGAGIDVFGNLVVDGTAGNEVVMRGDRLDHMFNYLPYDRVSGQWRGLRFFDTSYDNRISFADIHSCKDAIVCDSAAFSDETLRLGIDHSTIHNCDGYGVLAFNSHIAISNTQITNTAADCLAVYGGACSVVYTTLAQFYPFIADRGVALRMSNFYNDVPYPLVSMQCVNCIVTGYSADVLMGERLDDEETPFVYYFANCILRTPDPEATEEEEYPLYDVIYETAEDSINGKQHFANIDEDNLYYDFRLAEGSPAIGSALPVEGFADDRLGNPRSAETPSMGCYEY